MNYVLSKDRAGHWRWTLFAANHEAIAVSSEAYVNKQDAARSIELTKASVSAPIQERQTKASTGKEERRSTD